MKRIRFTRTSSVGEWIDDLAATIAWAWRYHCWRPPTPSRSPRWPLPDRQFARRRRESDARIAEIRAGLR